MAMPAKFQCLLLLGTILLSSPADGARVKKSQNWLPAGDMAHGEDTLDKADDRSQGQSPGEREVQKMAGGVSSVAEFSVWAMNKATAGARCARPAQGRRVVSVADQHGDFEGMLDHLQRLGLASTTATRDKSSWGFSSLWAGGDAIFVQTGDILDRGPDGKLMYEFLWALQDSALVHRPAGEVVLLTGNHELMVLKGDIRYVTNIDFCKYTSDNCGGSPPRSASYCDDCCNYDNQGCQKGWSCMEGNCDYLAAWNKKGEMGKEMRKRFMEGKMKLIYRVNGVVFTHAGLVSSIWAKIGASQKRDPLETLNNLTAKLFANSNGIKLSKSGNAIAAGSGQNGPMWTRVCYQDWYTKVGRRRRGAYYMDPDEFQRVEPGRCNDIRKSLKEISASRMVIGHCPQGPSDRSDGVQTDCSGSIVMADTYMSIAYADTRSSATYNMAALEFFSEDKSGKVSVIYSGRSKCASLPDV